MKGLEAGHPVPVQNVPMAAPIQAYPSRMFLLESGFGNPSLSTPDDSAPSGTIATGGPTECELDKECDDCNPCTDDECDPLNPNADEDGCVVTNTSDCEPCDDDDGLFCNGVDKCDGAGNCIDPLLIKESICNGGPNAQLNCQKGDIDCHACSSDSSRDGQTCCPGGGLCTAGICVGGDRPGADCCPGARCVDGDRDTFKCCPGRVPDVPLGVCTDGNCVGGTRDGEVCCPGGSCPTASCDQTGTCKVVVPNTDPCRLFPSQICDEEGSTGSPGTSGACVESNPGAGVGKTHCFTNADCDDDKACTGGEICVKESNTRGVGHGGQCVGGANPKQLCNQDTACGNLPENEGKCAGVCRPNPNAPRPCGPPTTVCNEDPTTCGPGRCCVPSGNSDFACSRTTRPDCTGEWLGVGDLATTTEDDGEDEDGNCKRKAGSEFPSGQQGDDFGCPKYSSGITSGKLWETFGPTGGADCRDFWEIGDDYRLENCDKGTWYEVHVIRWVGGHDRGTGSRMRITFYNANGVFIEDVITEPASSGVQLRTVIFGEHPIIPCQGIMTVKPAIQFSPDNRARWATTDTIHAGTNDADIVYTRAHGLDANGEKTQPLEAVAPGTVGLTSGVLAFEIVGDKVPEPLRACCESDTGNCTVKLPWVCELEGNTVVENASSCNLCSNLNVVGIKACNADTDCRVCVEDITIACSSDDDCVSVGGQCDNTAVCNPSPPACQDSACCDKTTGECFTILGGFCTADGTTPCLSTQQCEDLSLGVCEAPCPGGSNSQGFGTNCDPDCCEQPKVAGADLCSEADIVVINVPPPGTQAPVRLTFSGTNKNATFGDYQQDGNGTCQLGIMNEEGGTRDRGWWHAFSLTDCANVRLDLCCTKVRSELVHQPQWAFITTDCNPCTATLGNSIVGTGGTIPNIGTKIAENDRGDPFCTNADDLWQTYRHLPKGTYWHPIYTAPGGHFGEYQFHITAAPCQVAACCLRQPRCVDDDAGTITNPCDSDQDCTFPETCEPCAAATAPVCDDANGFWLGFGNIPIDDPPTVTCDFQPCGEGSCCTAPGVCRDEISDGVPMTAAFCKEVTGNPPNYVGGAKCTWPKDPCPACEIESELNCQLLSPLEHVPLAADLAITLAGAVHADDFIPSTPQIDNICVWGTYLDGSEQLTGRFGCNGKVEDDFRIRIYQDNGGTPGILVAQRDNHDDAGNDIVGFPPCPPELASCPGPVTVFKSEVDSGFQDTYDTYGVDPVEVFNLSFPTINLPAAGVTYWLEVANNTHTLRGDTEPTKNRCNWHWMQVYYQDDVGNDYAAVGTNDVPGDVAGSGYLGWRSASWTDLAFCLGGPTGPVLFDIDDEPTGACCRCPETPEEEPTCEDGLTLHDCAAVPSGVWRGKDTACSTTGLCTGPLSPGDDCGTAALGAVAAGLDCTPPQPEPGATIPIKDGTFATNTACATTDGPLNPGGDTESFLGHDVWFEYTAQCTGKLWATQCAHTAHNELPYDPYMALYWNAGSPNQCLCPGSSLATQIGESDEGCDGIPDTGAGGFFGDRIVFPGECYLIRVGGWASTEAATSRGPVILGVQCEEVACFPSNPPLSPDVLEEVTKVSAAQNTATTGASLKNRYLTVMGGDAGRSQAIRVRVVGLPAPYSVWNGWDFWVSSLSKVCENGGASGTAPCAAPAPGLATNWYYAAKLSCDWEDALFRDWTTLETPVHIYNQAIVPSNRAQGKDDDAIYEVAFVDDSCPRKDEASYSDPLTIVQPRWGDLLDACNKDPCSAPQGITNIGDVTGILAKFQNLPGSPIKSRADLVGLPGNEGQLDRVISIVDVTWDLDAFVGGKYGFDPCPCGRKDPCGVDCPPCRGAVAMGGE
jgi:hypothetical protein